MARQLGTLGAASARAGGAWRVVGALVPYTGAQQAQAALAWGARALGLRQAGARGGRRMLGRRRRPAWGARLQALGRAGPAAGCAKRTGHGWLGGLGALFANGLCTRCTQPVFCPV